MKIWIWIKSLSWVVIASAIVAAIMFIINAYRAGKMEAKVVQGESQIKRLREGQSADVKAAKKLQDKIATKKIQARLIRKKSEASFERMGQDETTADIAARFNGKRVRSREDTAAELSGS